MLVDHLNKPKKSWIIAVKRSIDLRSSTTSRADPELKIPVAAGKSYALKGWLSFLNSNITLQFYGPYGATMVAHGESIRPGLDSSYAIRFPTIGTTHTVLNFSTSAAMLRFWGVLKVAAAGGFFGINWNHGGAPVGSGLRPSSYIKLLEA